MNNEIYVCEGIIYYYGNPVGRLLEEKAMIDSMFDKPDLVDYIAHELSREVIVAEEVYYSIFHASEEPKSQDDLIIMKIRIYQLSASASLKARFVTLAEREVENLGLPERKEYDLVYEMSTDHFDLEEIWDCFTKRLPRDYKGRSMSISDVVELDNGKESSFFYLERMGFTPITFNDTANADQI